MTYSQVHTNIRTMSTAGADLAEDGVEGLADVLLVEVDVRAVDMPAANID